MEHADTLERIDSIVASTRAAVFVRSADGVLLIRPDKSMGVNDSAAAILGALYARKARPAAEVLPELAPRLGTSVERLIGDAHELVETIGGLLNDDYSSRPGLSFGNFDRSRIRYPTLSEIALTYACQNRCRFCYASSPHREGEHRLMTTAEVQLVMDRIWSEAHVPSLSFTGGEATLRADLPELIRYGADLGFRVNLITNGIRAADPVYARSLVDAGLASAQVSLEAGKESLHDTIVGRRGAFESTVAGVRSLQRLGIHVHTNTTLCAANLQQTPELIRFAARDLGLRTLSMNMVIRTGVALASQGMDVTYTEVGARLPMLLEVAAAEGIRLVWYSPIPYCIFNPVLHDLGAKSCACVDGILSVDPAGQVLPCSSFDRGLGSLLQRSWPSIASSTAAAYWRDKSFAPPVCLECRDLDVCGGGCPLYWDAAGTFAEIPRSGADDSRQRRRWEQRRRRGGSFGVPAPPGADGPEAEGARSWAD